MTLAARLLPALLLLLSYAGCSRSGPAAGDAAKDLKPAGGPRFISVGTAPPGGAQRHALVDGVEGGGGLRHRKPRSRNQVNPSISTCASEAARSLWVMTKGLQADQHGSCSRSLRREITIAVAMKRVARKVFPSVSATFGPPRIFFTFFPP